MQQIDISISFLHFALALKAWGKGGGATVSLTCWVERGHCWHFRLCWLFVSFFFPPLCRWMPMETSSSQHLRWTTKWCLQTWGAASVTLGILSCPLTAPGSSSGSPWRPAMASATTRWIGAPCVAGPTVDYDDAPPSSSWKSPTWQMLAPLTSGPVSFSPSPLDFST